MRHNNSKSFSISLKNISMTCYSHDELHNSSTSFHNFSSWFNHLKSFLFPVFVPGFTNIFLSVYFSLCPLSLLIFFSICILTHICSHSTFLFIWKQLRRNFWVNSASICGVEGSDPAPYFHYKLRNPSYTTRMKQCWKKRRASISICSEKTWNFSQDFFKKHICLI